MKPLAPLRNLFFSQAQLPKAVRRERFFAAALLALWLVIYLAQHFG